MIPLENLRAVKHIVAHENCADGVASAMILKQVLPDAKVTFCQYNTPRHRTLKVEEGMVFCDFSPFVDRPRGTTDAEFAELVQTDRYLKEFVDAGTIVLDHHKTQKPIVQRFGNLGVFGDEVKDPGVCGAVLAYREVWMPIAADDSGLASPDVPDLSFMNTKEFMGEFAYLAGIRDTWQRKDPRWEAACEQGEALTWWPAEELLDLSPDQWAAKLALGPILYQRRLRGAQKATEGGWRFTTKKGTRVIMFEGLKTTSDAAEYLDHDVDFVVGFGYRKEPKEDKIKVIYSTRSHTGFDCAAFAKHHPGGGGHTAAAGFSVLFDPKHFDNPYGWLQKDLQEYETPGLMTRIKAAFKKAFG